MTVSNETDIYGKQNLHWPVISVVANCLGFGPTCMFARKEDFYRFVLHILQFALIKSPHPEMDDRLLKGYPDKSLPLLSISVDEVRRLAKNLVYGTNLTNHKPDYLRPFA